MGNLRLPHNVYQLTAFLIGALSIVSCDESKIPAYSHYEKIPSRGWEMTDPLIFDPWPSDSILTPGKEYRIDLHVRYTARRRIPPVPVAVERENAEGPLSSDTIMVTLFGTDGHPAAKGHMGIYEAVIPLERNLRLSEGYNVTLTPLLDGGDTRGLLDIGLIMWPM